MRHFIRAIFFGNIFYGLCTAALSIETTLQLRIPLNHLHYYLLTFLLTIGYYSHIYYSTSSVIHGDERSDWYRTYHRFIRLALIALCIIVVVEAFFIILNNYLALYRLSATSWMLMLIVPVIGLLYTFRLFSIKQLRLVGWLKPFVIGFVWAGIVTAFPLLFQQLNHPGETTELPAEVLFWLQNFLFISTLALVFDIKDCTSDLKMGLLTIPARIGIAQTISWVVIPTALLSFVVLFFF